ncbi:hypothetical protein JB92DRAFT_2758369 [Gautieria morchelliformis]|nr:hypothetical protein JB92DRAFT_2758369 [Gautieria morchelliformis]
MISTFVLTHRVEAFLFRLILVASCSGLSKPRPMPPKEWSVTPPMLQAAMPVEAVMATASSLGRNLWRRLLMISRSSTDFPVPICVSEPVKNTLFPASTSLRICCCSLLRKIRATLVVTPSSGSGGTNGLGAMEADPKVDVVAAGPGAEVCRGSCLTLSPRSQLEGKTRFFATGPGA